MTGPDTRKAIPWSTQTPDGQVLLTMPWEIVVPGAAVLSIVNLFLMVFVRDPSLDLIIGYTDGVMVLIFLLGFVRRLRVADDDRAYLTHGFGWLDLVSIFPLLRIARLLRVVRVVRLVGRMGGPIAAARAE